MTCAMGRGPVIFAACLLAAGLAGAQGARRTLGRQAGGEVLVPTNQTLTPLGTVRLLEGVRPKDLALSPDGRTVAVLTTARVVLFDAGGAPRGEVSLKPGPLGLAWAPDGRTLFASGENGVVCQLVPQDDGWKAAGSFPVNPPAPQTGGERTPGNPQVTGLAVAPDGRRLYVALGIRNSVAVVDLPDERVAAVVPVGVAPYRILLSRDGRTLFAANRGGFRVKAARDTAPSAGTPVRTDPRTDAARRGSVSIVDTADFQTREVEVGRQPSGIALSKDGHTLYVANSDDDTVSVLDTTEGRVRRTVSVRPPEDPRFGQIPTDVALSESGAGSATLFVACGGGNAVAVVDLSRRPRSTGYVPTGWFPIALAARDGQLFVASAKGIGARPQRGGPFAVHGSVGAVQFITPEERRDLDGATRQVARNNHWGEEPRARPEAASAPVPERVGEPSMFRHVVYIIKENHTYDLDLGDMAEGNGDRTLTIFGEKVTPNEHALARQFVLLDNTYTSGTNSADGHQWTDSAAANGYIEQNYAASSRSYPYDGGDPLAYSPEGFLWTAALRRGVSVRVYGEFVNHPRITDTQGGGRPTWRQLWDDYRAGVNRFRITAGTDNAALRPVLHPRYVGFPLSVSDQWRASQFLTELKEWEGSGGMPALCMLELPNDHTTGIRAGFPTARAQVADNDLALGRIIEGISHSRFWRDTLVLVIEDDSQFGLDHVDGHRTVAFCISPYTRRGAVISEPYNHTSFVRTIELVLGLPPMTRFDRTAQPLTACFTGRPDLHAYDHLPNGVPLDEMNPSPGALRGEARRLAEASARLDWSDVDRADAETIARAVWHSRRPNESFPGRKFHPPSEASEKPGE